jgi:hypothetical protein
MEQKGFALQAPLSEDEESGASDADPPSHKKRKHEQIEENGTSCLRVIMPDQNVGC